VLLGSSVLDIILYGTSPILEHEVHIATPCYAKQAISSFFCHLGFATDQYPSSYTPPSVLAMYDYETVQKDGKKVVIINSNTYLVLPVVLAHHSSTDCIFFTSGGMFISYPELMDSKTTFLPLSHLRLSAIHAFTK
jgi:hypothetical protein